MRTGRKADAALEAAALMVDAVNKLTGLVTEINESQGSLIQSVGELTGHMELVLVVEGLALRTLVELCDRSDQTDLLLDLKVKLGMVNEAAEAAAAREGGPDL